MTATTGPGENAARLRELLAADPTRVLALSVRDQWEIFACLRGLGALPEAAELLVVLAETHGPLAKVLDAQAQLWPLLGRDEEAIAAARERAERFPSQSGELALTRAYLVTGQLAEAAELAERMLARDSRSITLLQLLAQIALEQGDGETALELYDQIAALRPEGGEPQLGPARARAALGEDEAAQEALRAFVARIGPETKASTLTAWAELAAELGDDVTDQQLRARAAALWDERAAGILPALAATLLAREPDPELAGADELDDADLAAVEDGAVEAPPEALAAARDLFGYDRLRPGQARVIDQVLRGVDTLATMPTGAGKSLCYQLPAMLLPGVTVVISPLIALMQDQVESLPPAVAARATLINSAVGAAENRRRLAGIARGDYSLVYAAPERLRQAPFLRALAAAGVSLLVIDEAHCISLWGHDFRPDYLIVPRVLPALGEPPVLALTATATPEIAREIGQRLGRDLARVRVSLFRPNLFYEVRQLANREEKYRAVVDICRAEEGAGIVYVSSRDGCEQVATLLNRELKARRHDPDVALAYHAGFGGEDRADRMRRFMTGEVRIMVATVAFGMGVDKADVRFIIHLNPPKSLEAYAQESGRAGRDGQPARCVLLYAPADRTTLQRRAKADEFDIETLRRAYASLRRLLGQGWGIAAPDALASALSGGGDADEDRDARVALGILERAGLLERHPDAPRTLSVTLRQTRAVPADERWPAFLAATGIQPGDEVELDTVAIGATLDLSPAELEGLLLGWSEETGALDVYADRRELCLRLVLPAPPAAAASLPRLLDDVRRENARRVARMIAYATGRTCRHVALAAHLGERLEPCGTACDICTTRSAERGTQNRTEKTTLDHRPTPPSDAEAALTILTCLKQLPFSLGKSGLTKVLAGSITAAVKEDRAPQFGALAGLSQTRINGLLDRLIVDGFVYRDDGEYRLLSLTPEGRAADLATLSGYAAPLRESSALAGLKTGTSRSATDVGADDDGVPLTAEQEALLGRLKAWRSAQARARAIPPYIIAHDRQLREVVLHQPATPEDLQSLKGFGPAKVDTYGAAILALLAGADLEDV
jgi:ATP-dependent DNA helicase RecQ